MVNEKMKSDRNSLAKGMAEVMFYSMAETLQKMLSILNRGPSNTFMAEMSAIGENLRLTSIEARNAYYWWDSEESLASKSEFGGGWGVQNSPIHIRDLCRLVFELGAEGSMDPWIRTPDNLSIDRMRRTVRHIIETMGRAMEQTEVPIWEKMEIEVMGTREWVHARGLLVCMWSAKKGKQGITLGDVFDYGLLPHVYKTARLWQDLFASES